MRAVPARRSMGRLFAVYAAISLIPVLILGVVLAASLRGEATTRGLAEGKSEAVLVARTAVEPLLHGRPLSARLGSGERIALRRLTSLAIGGGELLRLRLRDLAGAVVFSDDGSGFASRPEDEALEAARGEVVARLTRLNSDANDSGHRGVASVEIYLPLRAGTSARRIGVLELYLPYAPISRDVTAGLHQLYLGLIVGLTLVYLALFAITASVSGGLRREAAINAFLAEHDILTALPNRVRFHRDAEKLLSGAIPGREPLAIAIVDLDRFKDVNDTLGHQSGDQLLTEIALRIAANMRAGDTVARLGGDEFGLIMRNGSDAQRALHRLRDVIDREVDVRGLPLSMQASIGFAIAPEDGVELETLLQRADVAMYMAKARHAGVLRYDACFDHYDAAKLGLVAELRHAIDDGQLALHYQPQLALESGRIEAVEALVRWQHPTHGLLYPDRFLPLAEQTDLIDRLTDWVLRAALGELGDLGPPWTDQLKVAVNVSARSIGRVGFAPQVIRTLEALDVPADRLILEVTETALLADPDRAATALGELAAAGISISLDDFGQGQTSLGYLSALPIDELKIDKSFVIDMLDNPAHAAIVLSIVDLGHNLDLRVVGEGVESEVILAALGKVGCDVAQGFLLARPMPAKALRGWLASMPAPVRL